MSRLDALFHLTLSIPRWILHWTEYFHSFDGLIWDFQYFLTSSVKELNPHLTSSPFPLKYRTGYIHMPHIPIVSFHLENTPDVLLVQTHSLVHNGRLNLLTYYNPFCNLTKEGPLDFEDMLCIQEQNLRYFDIEETPAFFSPYVFPSPCKSNPTLHMSLILPSLILNRSDPYLILVLQKNTFSFPFFLLYKSRVTDALSNLFHPTYSLKKVLVPMERYGLHL